MLLLGCTDVHKNNSAEDSYTLDSLTTFKDTTDGVCTELCDASAPSYPFLNSEEGKGAVTTYGSVHEPEASSGGACNYGETEVYQFAAIQVNQLPDDDQGQWKGGSVCGQCAKVRIRSGQGWKETVVRIMDKCPDEYCGIDLGGAPAFALMGDSPGRYSGEWQFVSCSDYPETFDGKSSLFIKEGSSEWWSLIHVRNPLESVSMVRIQRESSVVSDVWDTLGWAEEAENFFTVPMEILKDTSRIVLEVHYRTSPKQILFLKGSDLSKSEMLYHFSDSLLNGYLK